MDCQAFSYPIKLSSQIMIPKHGMAQTSAVLIWLVLFLDIVWWCHDMETLSVLLALYKGNPPITGGFPSQRASDRNIWCSLLCWISWINSRVASNLGWHDPHVTNISCSISHNAPFRTEMCTFLFWTEHCGYGTNAFWDLWIWSILSIVKLYAYLMEYTPCFMEHTICWI